MVRLMVGVVVLLVAGDGWSGEPKPEELKAQGPAAQRGWIVVVREPGGGVSGRFTDQLPGKYSTRSVDAPAGLQFQVFDNEEMQITGGAGSKWSVVASRCYQGGGFLWTRLVFLDPPPKEFSDAMALDLLLAYKSFAFGEVTYVIFCPPRAKIAWKGDFATEGVTGPGQAKANATLTITLDKRTPTVVSGKVAKVEADLGRILVHRTY